MAEQIYAEDCDEHDHCTVIVSDDADTGENYWRSHMDANVDPAVRLNPDYPTAGDKRDGKKGEVKYRCPTPGEAAAIGYDRTTHRLMAAYAAVVGAVSLKAAAEASGHTTKALTDEALAWGLA